MISLKEWWGDIIASVRCILKQVLTEYNEQKERERERLHLARFEENPRIGHEVRFSFAKSDVVEKGYESVFSKTGSVGIRFKFIEEIEQFITERKGHKKLFRMSYVDFTTFMIDRGRPQPDHLQVIMFPYLEDAVEFKLRFM